MTEEVSTSISEVAPSDTPWYSGADTDTVSYIESQGWKNPLEAVSAVRSYLNTKGVPDGDLLRLPKELDTETKYNILGKLGRPASADGYSYTLPEESVLHNDRWEPTYKEFTAKAHELGLTQEQFKGALDWYNQSESKAYESLITSHEQKMTQELEGLKKEWGQAFEEKVRLGNLAVKNLGLSASDEEALLNQVGSRPLVARLMSQIGTMFREAKGFPMESFVKSGAPDDLKGRLDYKEKEYSDYKASLDHKTLRELYDTDTGRAHPARRELDAKYAEVRQLREALSRQQQQYNY